MSDFMEHLQFTTAIPFGYAIFYGLGVVLALIFIRVVVSASDHKKPFSLRSVSASLGLMFIATVLAANVLFGLQLDFNPFFRETDMAGHWTDGDSTLELRADKTVRFDFGKQYADREPEMSGSGTWRKRDDFEIEIASATGKKPAPPMRVIKNGNEFRLIVEDFDDPDYWDHHLGFKRQHDPKPGMH